MSNCQSCTEDRKKKNLEPVARTRLPAGITDPRNFRKPRLATYVCPYCDGETLVTTALRNFKARND